MAAWTYTQNFDALNTADLTGQDSWSGSTDYDVQTGVTFGGSTKAVKMAADNVTIDRTITGVDSGDLYFVMRFDGSNANGAPSLQLLGGTTFGMAIQFVDDGSPKRLIAVGTSQIELLSNPTSGLWYVINVNFISATTFKVRWKVEGGTFSSFTSTLTHAGSVSSPTTIRLSESNAHGADAYYWDEIGTTDPDVGVTFVPKVVIF